jgi:hypothetical protein
MKRTGASPHYLRERVERLNYRQKGETMKKAMLLAKGVLLSLGFLVCAFLLAPTANAQSVPNFGGSYNITGYFEPALTGSYTWCFNFTKTGGVLFPNSGTWNVPSYTNGWSGTWYQDGDEVILHGVADGTYIFSWKGRLVSTSAISGRQVEFYINGNTDTAGTFDGTKTSACPAEVSDRTGDPAK